MFNSKNYFKLKRILLKNNIIKKINSFVNKSINYVIIKYNRYRNKSFIPHPRNSIHVETTSLCNLKCKFCAYEKRDLDLHPSQTMKIENFKNIIHQCINEKYKYIGLTPTTGDIFMDKNIFEKLKYLEDCSGINGFFFYTNFIPIKTEKIENLISFEKLRYLGLSIYGHDQETFINFTKSSEVAYRKLIENLKTLERLFFEKRNKIKNISINLRSTKNFLLDNNNSDLCKIIKKIIKYEFTTYTYTHEYNNWGNLIKNEDIKNLNIHFSDKNIIKNGACSLIFGKNIIGVNGNVNACACRDANFSLRIGNVYNNSLGKILSKKNDVYTKLIQSQNDGHFPDVCKSCDFYTSIYLPKNRRGYTEVPEKDLKSIKEFYEIIN